MTLEFVKMTGAGNDFILIDNRARTVSLSREQVRRLCNRHFGVGADGLILLEKDATGVADWAWTFYNSDGSDADMCGNGARCFAQFIRETTKWSANTLTFQTLAGVIHAQVIGQQVAIGLTAPKDLRRGQKLETTHGTVDVHFIHTGVPHAVVFVPDADAALVSAMGSEIRWHTHFQPSGTNVNFVQILAPNWIRVRTYERGVEGETLACGTGVTASALILASQHEAHSPVRVQVEGGDELEVHFNRTDDRFEHVQLIGPAQTVFRGALTL